MCDCQKNDAKIEEAKCNTCDKPKNQCACYTWFDILIIVCYVLLLIRLIVLVFGQKKE